MPTKVCLVKAMVFPLVMCGCESWTTKKTEHQRIEAFELWCWRRLLRVPWTARRSNQSILKEIRPGCSLEGLMLSWNSNTLATWCEELTHLKRPWCWKTLKTGGEGDRGWGGWMASLTQWTWVWVSSWSWCWTRRPGLLQLMGSQRVEHNWVTEHGLNYQSLYIFLQNSLLLQDYSILLVQIFFNFYLLFIIVVALDLHCNVWALWCSMQAFLQLQCTGFCCCRAQAQQLQHAGSQFAASR